MSTNYAKVHETSGVAERQLHYFHLNCPKPAIIELSNRCKIYDRYFENYFESHFKSGNDTVVTVLSRASCFALLENYQYLVISKVEFVLVPSILSVINVFKY